MMITNFKIFESINIGEPKVGDYVITSSRRAALRMGRLLYPDRIGIIEEIEKRPTSQDVISRSRWGISKTIFYIFYPDTANIWRPVEIEGIEYWSENKEDLEPFLIAKKYNL